MSPAWCHAPSSVPRFSNNSALARGLKRRTVRPRSTTHVAAARPRPVAAGRCAGARRTGAAGWKSGAGAVTKASAMAERSMALKHLLPDKQRPMGCEAPQGTGPVERPGA